jgi:spermidine/putrescine transport system ATP-binding protein
LHKSFQGVVAVDGVSLEIGRGEFFSLLGPSGCGKTTLLRMIAGFELPTAGEVLIQGRPMANTPPFARDVNTVFQHYALFPHLTVAENVGFGLRMKRVPKPEATRRVAEAIALVRLAGLESRRPRELSGGQQQRVALARALVNRPAVLLLDEPLGALDLKLRKEMQFELKRLQSDVGITFIYVTHDQDEALTMSDRVAVMSKGRVLQIGTPSEVYEEPTDRFVAGFIGEMNFIPGVVRGADNGRITVELDGAHEVDVDADRLARGRGVVAGEQVTIAIRPEHIDLGPAATSGHRDAGLPGVVEQVLYAGADTLVSVRVSPESLLRVRRRTGEGFDGSQTATGATVTARWPARSARMFTD